MAGTTPTTVVIPTWAAMSLLTAMVFIFVGIRMDKVELAAEGSVSDYRRNHRGGGDVARLVDDDRPGRTLETHADAAGEAASPVTAKEPPAAGLSSTAQKYGFYLHVYNQPAAVIHQTFQLQKHFPSSPIYIMSDGGDRFDGLCQTIGVECTFKLCPPANDRWHPWPFMHRLRMAAVAMKTEYVIMLEPDNTVHGPLTHPIEYDAGGLHEDNPRFGSRIVGYVEDYAQKKNPGFKMVYHGSGLAGGSYFRTDAILDAFSDENVANINWTQLMQYDSKRVFSSDFAMPLALSLAGYTYHPWNDSISWGLGNQPNVTTYAFEHYRRNIDGGKPEYNRKIETWEQDALWAPGIKRFTEKNKEHRGQVFNGRILCQMCWNTSEYHEAYNSYDCANPIDVEVYSQADKDKYCSLNKWECKV